MKKGRYNIFFWGSIFTVIAILIGISLNDSTNYLVEILPLAQGKAGSDIDDPPTITIPRILCELKVTTTALDKDGAILAVDNSPLYKRETQEVTLSILKIGEDKIVDRFLVTPKLGCQNPVWFGTDYDTRLDSVSLRVNVYAPNVIDANGNKKSVYNDSMNKMNIEIGRSLTDLMTFSIRSVDIFKELPDGEYEVTLEFKSVGRYKVFFDVPTLPVPLGFTVNVGEEDIPSFLKVDVTEGTGGGGGGTGGGNVVEVDGDTNKNNNQINGIIEPIEKMITCISTGNINCLQQQEFYPFYLLGIGGIIFVGAFTKRNNPPLYDNFGNSI